MAIIKTGNTRPSSKKVFSLPFINSNFLDERVTFSRNSTATYDAVTALAYDDKTNLLHVGTSSGRSDFRGLRRINNTTTGITTAISASNKLIAEQ